MQNFIATRTLSRGRLTDSIKTLTQNQLNYRLHENTLTIGEMVIHVAGVEVSFASQLLGAELNSDDQKLKSAATDGAVNDLPFPYTSEEITPEFVQQCLTTADEWVTKLYAQGDAVLTKEIKSALGPIITGEGAFVRLGFHPGYHHGQVYMITTLPNFPTN
jgi:hypothetical protein